MMWPILGGLISGGASLLGNIFSSQTSAANNAQNNYWNSVNQQQAEQFNAGQAQIQRSYETQMSNTAYQRSRQDMIKAGLNPMVMASQGGASTPSVSAPSAPQPQPHQGTNYSSMSGIGDAVAKAISSANAIQDFDRRAADIDQTRQQTQTEQWKTLDQANQATRSGLGLPEARVGAGKAQELLDHPELIRQSARSTARKEAMGGGIVGEVSAAGGAIMDQVERKMTPMVKKLIDEATGHSAKQQPKFDFQGRFYGDQSGY